MKMTIAPKLAKELERKAALRKRIEKLDAFLCVFEKRNCLLIPGTFRHDAREAIAYICKARIASALQKEQVANHVARKYLQFMPIPYFWALELIDSVAKARISA